MSAPPWGHKPPAVDDVTIYWDEPPHELSPRVEYWLRRLTEGTWVPHHEFNALGYDDRAEYLGVYLWEYFNIIYPVLCGDAPTIEDPEPEPSLRRTLTLWIQP